MTSVMLGSPNWFFGRVRRKRGLCIGLYETGTGTSCGISIFGFIGVRSILKGAARRGSSSNSYCEAGVHTCQKELEYPSVLQVPSFSDLNIEQHFGRIRKPGIKAGNIFPYTVEKMKQDVQKE